MSNESSDPKVGILMGSASDWGTMKSAADTLEELGIAHEARVLSAHRTPAETAEYASTAEARGLGVIIAAAGGAAHLAGVVAAHTMLPVIGVPMQAWSLDGLDSLLSTVQMPRGIPVATVAIGKAGAVNAGILATQILATADPALRETLRQRREAQAAEILEETLE
ncbi:MAG: 5-(carboxyamino)imidazole ribonucleotide mutase [Chloroflexi bacterium]|nr:5-(carboxyamino)imidazole ribonucleotide mutase [Chloroflexota bacterium]